MTPLRIINAWKKIPAFNAEIVTSSAFSSSCLPKLNEMKLLGKYFGILEPKRISCSSYQRLFKTELNVMNRNFYSIGSSVNDKRYKNVSLQNEMKRQFCGCRHLNVESKILSPVPSTVEKFQITKKIIEDTKSNIIEDIQDTKNIVRVKVDTIIQKENIFTIPNALCVFRVAASPVLVYLVVTSSYSAALGLFLFAGFTDLMDGWIARTFPSQMSNFGSMLDPLADKILVSCLFLSLAYNGLIPVCIAGCIVYRDVAIMAGASYLRYRSIPPPRSLSRYFDASLATVQLSPTLISKLNTAVQISLITMTLAGCVTPIPHHYFTSMWFITLVSTVTSGASYIFMDDTYKMLAKMEQKTQENQDRSSDHPLH